MTDSGTLADLLSAADYAQMLRAAGIQPTKQRLAIAQILLGRHSHCTADEIWRSARAVLPSLARATIYNSLPLFVQHGLLRVLHIDGDCTIYDSRIDQHSHIYHEDTGVLEDMPVARLRDTLQAQLPDHLQLLDVDVIVRVRNRNDVALHAPDKTSTY